MADDLRTRLTEVLAATPTALLAGAGYSGPVTFHGEERGGHRYDGSCALCCGEIATLLDAIMPVVENAIRAATVYDCCGQLLYGPHTMACPRYVGPVDHWRVRGPDGDVSCTCGWPWPASGEECDNAETWRGPLPDEDTP